MFSTITSPVFSELVIVLAGDEMTHLPQEVMLFNTLRRMNEARHFELVFLFEGPCFVQREGQRVLGEAPRELGEVLDSVIARGFLDFLDSPPTIRWARSHPDGQDTSFPHFD